MIDPQTLATLTNFSTLGLVAALANSGYENAKFETAKFLGIGRTGNFVYEVTYKCEHMDKTDVGHVYLSYDHELNSVSADY